MSREKIKACMIEYLKEHGYPAMSVNEILSHLKPMWQRLEERGLIQPGMTFQAYADSAFVQGLKRMMHEEKNGS